jgi:hypothetical protein
MAELETHGTIQEKNKCGRPLKFETVAELKQKIESYFNNGDPHTEMRRVEHGVKIDGSTNWGTREIMAPQGPYTLLGLARALKTTRDTFIDYESGQVRRSR